MDLHETCLHMLTACACEGLRRSARVATARYQEALAGTGVRAAQLPILVATNLMGPVPVTELADVLVIDRTTLTRNLHGLERQGLVTIGTGADGDRRVRLVALTGAGRTALESALEAWRGAQAGVAESFGAERLQGLVSELSAFTAATRG